MLCANYQSSDNTIINRTLTDKHENFRRFLNNNAYEVDYYIKNLFHPLRHVHKKMWNKKTQYVKIMINFDIKRGE